MSVVVDTPKRDVPLPWQLLRLMWPAPIVAQAIHTAAALRIPDLLESGPRTVRDLAQETGAHAISLGRLLRALTTVGIFAEDEGGGYQNTPLSELLRANHPRSLRRWAMLVGAPFIARPCSELTRTVATGEPAFAFTHNQSLYQYLNEHPDDAVIFHEAMSAGWEAPIPLVVATYDFSRFARIVDVGGGNGTLMRAILEQCPNTRGVLQDLPGVVPRAAALETGPLASRCEIVARDFFASVVEGGDAYLLRGIVHDWDDEPAIRILTNCRRAMRADSLLVVVDALLSPVSDPGRAMIDLLLMTLLGGRERTEGEYRELLQQSGFSLARIVHVPDGTCIIEGTPT
jgi:hypothetical protein